jgi:hypothetical protein
VAVYCYVYLSTTQMFWETNNLKNVETLEY